MNELSPAAKVKMLERSLQCFACSFFGLIPIVGLPAAVWAIAWASWVQFSHRRHWNPAGAYVNWAFALGAVGLVISLAVFTVAALTAIDGGGHSSYGPVFE